MRTVDMRSGDGSVLWRMPGGWKSAAIAPFRAVLSYFWVVRERLRGDPHGLPARIAERRHLKEMQQLSARVIAAMADAVMVTDPQRRLVFVNEAFSRLTGYSIADALGRTPAMLSSGRHSPEFYAEMWREIDEAGHWRGEIWNRRKSGEIFPELLSVSAVRNGNGEIVNYVGVFSDISASKQYEARLQHLAHHDALTGLANRALFQDRLREALGRARRQGRHAAVLFIDLDHFKNINDSLGHDVGDLLLQAVAARIVEDVREIDTVARLGGDEFAVLLEVIDNNRSAGTVARKLIDSLALPFQIAGHCFNITASIGIGCYPQDGSDPEELLKGADTAMYRAKALGRNNYRFSRGALSARAAESVSRGQRGAGPAA